MLRSEREGRAWDERAPLGPTRVCAAYQEVPGVNVENQYFENIEHIEDTHPRHTF